MGKKLLYYREKIDDEVNALDIKSRPVNFRVHIDDYYFVSEKDGWDYVHIFQHLPHSFKCYADCMCIVCTFYLLYLYREGISIGFNKWRQLLYQLSTKNIRN